MIKSLKAIEKSTSSSLVQAIRCLGSQSFIYGASMSFKSETQNFVNGRRCLPVNYEKDNSYNNINPATGNPIGVVHESDEITVNEAVQNAKDSFPAWAETTATERSHLLRRAAKLLTKRRNELAVIETIDTGKTITESTYDIDAVIECCNYFASLCYSLNGEQIPVHKDAFVYTRREPIGVCSGIGAWNFPIQNIAWKTLPALICGNTVVYKPSPLTPLSSTAFAEILCEAGLPPGCLNIVQGGASVGEMFCTHQDISKVSFTGSVGTGAKIMAACAPQIKPVTLELGGKSPLIIFDDVDIDNAVQGALMANFITQGEVCSNAARVFVHEAIYEKFVEKAVAATKKLRVGNTMDGRTQIGALISEEHLAKVTGFIERAVKEGATILCGGDQPDFVDTPFSRGYYLNPCVMDDCSDDMEIIKHEHFGPIMCLLKFSSEDEVIERANNTPFGLAGGVFTENLGRAHRVVGKINAGSCYVNTYNMYPVQVPFGGVKMSGIGRENGTAVLNHYTQLKTVYVETNSVESMFV